MFTLLSLLTKNIQSSKACFSYKMLKFSLSLVEVLDSPPSFVKKKMHFNGLLEGPVY